MADEIVSTTLLAFDGPIIFAPAMNVRMWEKPPVQRNIAATRADGRVIVGPESGHLSCGEVGAGRMAEAEVIFQAIADELDNGRAHPHNIRSHAAVPRPGRYLTNGSSGRMGKALAEAVLAAGHEVVVVSGPVEVGYPSAARVVPVISTEEMLAGLGSFSGCDGTDRRRGAVRLSARVVATDKIRKTRRRRTPRGNARHRRPAWGEQDYAVDGCLRLGDDRPPHGAMQKLQRKKCDLIVANGPATMMRRRPRSR